MHYRLIRTMAGKGTAAGQFREVLRGLAVDEAGLVYAVGDRAVKVFDQAGTLVRQWGLSRPAYCVAIEQVAIEQPGDKGGVATVWVGGSGQVERFDVQGKALPMFRDGQRLGTVTAIGLHGEDVLLADATARCIRRYDRAGTWRNDIGRDNNTQGFVIPNGYLDFRVDKAGVIHAINPARHRIERYSLDGKLLGHFGKFGMTQPEDFGGCCNPTNLALLPDSRLVVTEKAPPRLKVYDAGDKVAAVVTAEAFDPQCRNMSLAVDSQGHIYVADTERLCILVFAVEGGSSSAPASAEQSAEHRS